MSPDSRMAAWRHAGRARSPWPPAGLFTAADHGRPRTTFPLGNPDLNWPEPTPSGLVPEVCGLVRGADEQALARLDNLLAAVWRSVPFHRARDERLQESGLRPPHGVHLGDLD